MSEIKKHAKSVAKVSKSQQRPWAQSSYSMPGEYKSHFYDKTRIEDLEIRHAEETEYEKKKDMWDW